jgi:hypothetical protein
MRVEGGTVQSAHLDLPRKLDLVGDVQVDLEVEQRAHALVSEGVQALQNLGRGCAA